MCGRYFAGALPGVLHSQFVQTCNICLQFSLLLQSFPSPPPLCVNKLRFGSLKLYSKGIMEFFFFASASFGENVVILKENRLLLLNPRTGLKWIVCLAFKGCHGCSMWYLVPELRLGLWEGFHHLFCNSSLVWWTSKSIIQLVKRSFIPS